MDYYYREREKVEVAQLGDGSVMLSELLTDEMEKEVQSRRETEIISVKWLKLNGEEVLEETDWHGEHIPIVKVIGDELHIDGKLVLKGIVRDATEPQRQYNFMKTAATEAIALAPTAPYIGAEGQFEGHETQWQLANRKNFAYLQYKPTDVLGNPAPPPQRNNTEPAIQAITLATNEAANDLKAVTGIWEAALGQPSNEISGKAILARQQQTQGSNFHYLDNLNLGLRHTGRIILTLIPFIYDTERVVRIVGIDGQQKTVTINGAEASQDVEKVYDLTTGTYDVTISTGPSYQTRRQELVSTILELYKTDPEMMKVTADLFIGEMDFPGHEKFAERLRKTLPPGMADDDDQGKDALPPQVSQALQQQQQQIQQLTQALQHAEQDVAQHLSVKKAELDSRERVAAGDQRLKELQIQLEVLKIQVSLETAQAQLNAQAGEMEAQQTFEHLQNILSQHHEAAMQQMGHEQGMQAGEQQQEFTQQNQQDDQQTQTDNGS